jgi:NADH-quinone oxidoreductase subunit A
MTSDYVAAAIAILAGVGMAVLLTLASKYLGPNRPTRAKQIAYEAGSEPIGSPRARFSVKF